MRRGAKQIILVCLAVCGLSLCAAAAQACPMCSQSIAEENLLPHAYMYSILFMLGMPALVFTGIGTAVYLKFRRHYAAVPVPAVPGMPGLTAGDVVVDVHPVGSVRTSRP